MRVLIVFILFVFGGTQFNVHGQQLNFVKRSMELPSQECYNIYQDAKGYIWFSTVRGFCKYDGKTITLFDKKNGLHENSVYSVVEDKKGRIWILTRKNRILYIENDKLVEPAISRKFSQLPELTVSNFGYHFKLINDGNELLVNTYLNTYRIDLKKETIQRLDPVENKELDVLQMKYVDQRITQISPSIFGPRSSIQLELFDESNALVLKRNKESVDLNYVPKVSRTVDVNGISYFSYANTLFQFSRRTNRLERIDLPGRIICVYKDKDNGIWAGVIGKGVFYFKNGNVLEQPIHSMKEYSVSGICEDSEGGIWATTLHKGIFYCRSKHVVSYRDVSGLHMPGNLLTQTNDKIFVGSESFGLISIDYLNVQPIKIDFMTEAITDVVFYDNKYVIGSLYSTLTANKSFTKFKRVLRSDKLVNHSSHKMRMFNDTLYSVLNNYLFEYNPKLEAFDLKFHTPIKIRDFLKLNAEEWLVGDWTLIKYNAKNNTHQTIKGLENPVSSMWKTRDGHIVIATIGGGLFEYVNGELRQLNIDIPGLPEVIYDIEEDANGFVWLASNQGLIQLDMNRKSVVNFGTKDGLLSNDIQQISISKNKMFLYTVEGLCAINLSALKKKTNIPRIYFLNGYFNGNHVNLLKHPTIDHAHNNLMLKTTILKYGSENEFMHYELILDGDTLNSETVDGTDLVLDNLEPGSYILNLMAVNDDGIRSKPLKFKFTINPPFWKTIWFLALMILVVGGCLFFVLRFITRSIRAREQQKTHINELLANSKLVALQAQMNPHFIFNSINSIQNFILNRDVNQAYDYLTKFSQLIRLVLQNSRKRETSLHEELNVLKLYISLEQLRFDNRFEYIQYVDPQLDLYSTFIPPMLIQPIIENSIWHGLMPLNDSRKGVVRLEIKMAHDLLEITIEDNGVGRSNSVYDSLHESISTDVAQERLAIVNLLQEDKRAKMETIDLVDEQNLPIGTKVILFLPFEKDNI